MTVLTNNDMLNLPQSKQAGLETCETADSEVCATQTKSRIADFVAQISKSAVAPASKPAQVVINIRIDINIPTS